jgi:hypothetical protein
MSDSIHIPTREAAYLAGLDPVFLWRNRDAFVVSKGWGGRPQIERASFMAWLAQHEAEARAVAGAVS